MSKNEMFEVQDFTLNYDSPLEDFDEENHGKQYSSPRAMKRFTNQGYSHG
jgi:hypothetical protein